MLLVSRPGLVEENAIEVFLHYGIHLLNGMNTWQGIGNNYHIVISLNGLEE